MAEEFKINTPGVLASGTAGGYMPVIIDDIIPERYPDNGTPLGATLAIYRPGELEPVKGLEKVPIPRGAMLCYIVPEEAINLRPAYQQVMRAQQERLRQEMIARGEMGRRG